MRINTHPNLRVFIVTKLRSTIRADQSLTDFLINNLSKSYGTLILILLRKLPASVMYQKVNLIIKIGDRTLYILV